MSISLLKIIAPLKLTANAGDTAPDLEFNLSRDDCSIVDLTDCTVDFKIYDPLRKLVTNAGSTLCSIVDGPAGQCLYEWGDDDILYPRIYTVNLHITYPSGNSETVTGRLTVGPVIA